MPYGKDAHDLLRDYLEKLTKREQAEFIRLSMVWENISAELEGLISKLSQLENLTEDQLYRLSLYREFLEESRVATNTYSRIAEGIIIDEQKVFAQLGIQSAQDLIGVSFFNRINFDAVKFMIGNTREGTPLFDLLQKSYPETVDRITQTLIDSMALGRNPIETARLLRADMDGNLNRALLVSRTEQMRVFREAQVEQYLESGLVTGLELITEPDACEICLDIEDGNPYPLDYNFDLHPNCRCGIAPVL